jgi:hypothetical protein
MLSCFHSSTENSLYIDAVALTLTLKMIEREWFEQMELLNLLETADA